MYWGEVTRAQAQERAFARAESTVETAWQVAITSAKCTRLCSEPLLNGGRSVLSYEKSPQTASGHRNDSLCASNQVSPSAAGFAYSSYINLKMSWISFLKKKTNKPWNGVNLSFSLHELQDRITTATGCVCQVRSAKVRASSSVSMAKRQILKSDSTLESLDCAFFVLKQIVFAALIHI